MTTLWSDNYITTVTNTANDKNIVKDNSIDRSSSKNENDNNYSNISCDIDIKTGIDFVDNTLIIIVIVSIAIIIVTGTVIIIVVVVIVTIVIPSNVITAMKNKR